MYRMMKQYSFLLLLLLTCFSAPLFAAQLKGKIVDEKGETLPFATVFLQGTTIGTSANAHGEYQLSLQPGNYKVVCQYIGFKQTVFSVTVSAEDITHDFVLHEQSLEMKEVVIKSTDEDPGYRIIREAIKKRSYHLKQVKSFQTGIYLKGVLRSRSAPSKIFGQEIDKGDLGLDTGGKGVLYLCEEFASYYASGGKEKTIIHSVKESGDPKGVGFSQLPPVITFYENNVTIGERLNPRGFVSPVADNAIGFYKYKLLGEFTENEHIIYKIQVTPRRLYEPCFQGVIYIVDNEWSIHSLNMTLTKKSNMEMLDTMRIDQVFLPLKDAWVIKSQVWYPVFGMFGFDFTGNFVTVYDNQKLNEPVPDTIFNNKIISAYDKGATKKDSAFWQETRPIKLEKDEVRDYVLKDSIRIKFENPKYVDSLRRKGNKIKFMDVVFRGLSLDGKGYVQNWHTNGLIHIVNYNTVEGLNLAPKVWWTSGGDTSHTIRARVAARYGFSNKHFNLMAGLNYTHWNKDWRGRSWTIGAEGGKYVFQFNPANPINPFMNTVYSLLYHQNYMKIYERTEATLRFARNYGNGFRWNVKLSYQQRQPLENTTDMTWASQSAGGFSDNKPSELSSVVWQLHYAAIATVALSYQPGVTYTLYPDFKMPHRSRFPVFTLIYQKGIPNIMDSKSDFDKWRFSITDDLSLKLAGALSYNISAGGFLSNKYVSIPDMNHINGNQVFAESPSMRSFQLVPYYQYSNTDNLYGEAHVEYELKGLITNKIPVFKQLHWYLVCGTNSFYVNEQKYHVEAYAGLDNIGFKLFRPLRVDFIYAWDGYTKNSYGFRLCIKPSGLLRIKLDDTNGEEW